MHQVLDSTALFDPGTDAAAVLDCRLLSPSAGRGDRRRVASGAARGRTAAAQVEQWRATEAGLAALCAHEARRAPRQQALLALLADNPGGLSGAAIAARVARWREVARALQQRGWIDRHQADAAAAASRPSGPRPEALHADQRGTAPVLSAPQIAAVARSMLARDLRRLGTARRDRQRQDRGLSAVRREHVLARGRSVLMLVPEIALTAQLMERVHQRLPVRMAVLHSGLSDAERLAAWRAARAGAARRRARHALGSIRAAARPRSDHRRRGARQLLQAA